MEEIWGINFAIVNNTDYVITITDAFIDPLVVPVGETVEWTEINKSTAIITDFAKSGETSYMNGSVVVNSTDGVVVNRGDLTTQNITMAVYVNGMGEFNETQTSNGSITVCSWEDFENGGNISLTFTETV